jgi:hypothetical protein
MVDIKNDKSISEVEIFEGPLGERFGNVPDLLVNQG